MSHAAEEQSGVNPSCQEGYAIRCEWGEQGVGLLAPISDAVVIVDVLSFSTAVSVAVERGARVYPYRWQDTSAEVYAESLGALLSNPDRGSVGLTLSPASLLRIQRGTRLVLPSPNGSTLSLLAESTPTFAGCLRNASAVAAAAMRAGQRITIIPAGERWADGSLRPALEDLIGAGAIIHGLAGSKSPEAQAAQAAFLAFRADLTSTLMRCSSGEELQARGFATDVGLASALNATKVAPILVSGAYRGDV